MHYADDLTPETILRAQAGDSDALGAVLTACDPRLRAMARRVQKNDDLEETLVQYGRMGVVKAVRTFQPGRGTFWTFAHLHAKGSMIDGYAAELGLSSDARKAYRKVLAAYQRLEEAYMRPPTSAAVAAECGVTRGLVEQIVRVLFKPVQSLDELAEAGRDKVLASQEHQATYTTDPDDLFDAVESAAASRMKVQALCEHCLGLEEAKRFLVLTILREGNGGYDCGWDEIAASLRGDSGSPEPEWAAVIEVEFASWSCLPPDWPAVRTLFLRQHPAPTGAYLRQRFSQARRALGSWPEARLIIEGG
jgi:DNA-directed RNA polymerase specialized sigma subunit